ncbi:MAG: hypothetical protein KG028_07130 [Actinobacteria bacterium]|jgi:hypothetical protein|nr:hypothetical protein [Actinomycetota bacterium]
MTTFEHSETRSDTEDELALVPDDAPDDAPVGTSTSCVVCGAPVEQVGCCSFSCVRDARRELDQNLARLRSLQTHDGPTGTRTRLTERNGALTAALMGWRQ